MAHRRMEARAATALGPRRIASTGPRTIRLQRKRALITGAARGIGLAFAQAYARQGARVTIGDVAIDRAREAVSSILGAMAVPLAVPLDVTRQDSIDAAAAEVAWGDIDILVNNAALFDAAPIVEITRESFDRLFTVNLAGVVFTTRAVARSMIARRGQGGKIINMASQANRWGEPLVAFYCAAMAAVISFTQSAGLALIWHGINVNAITPGVVEGEHWEGVDAQFAKWENRPLGEKKRVVGEAVPAGRMGTAEDLVPMAIFLASPDSDYVVSQTYAVDGGNWVA